MVRGIELVKKFRAIQTPVKKKLIVFNFCFAIIVVSLVINFMLVGILLYKLTNLNVALAKQTTAPNTVSTGKALIEHSQ